MALTVELNNFENWIKEQPANTPETAYSIIITGISSSSLGSSSTTGTLGFYMKKYSSIFIDIEGFDLNGLSRFSLTNKCFEGCTGLVGITIPTSDDRTVEVRGDGFGGCSNLTRIGAEDIHAYDTSHNALIKYDSGRLIIGTNNTDLVDLDIPGNRILGSIDSYAFEGRTGLKTLYIPNTVTSIGQSAFSGCINLESVGLPVELKYINQYTFKGCSKLYGISITPNVTEIGNYAFQNCTSLSIVSINSNVLKKIGNHAFENCENIPVFTIPKTVTHIGEWAFQNCKNLKTITIPNSVIDIGWGAFLGCTKIEEVVLPEALTEIKSLFSQCTGLKRVIIQNGVTKIHGHTFSGCINLEEFVIPDSVTYIGEDAFYSCNFSNFTIPKTITYIDDAAFRNCKNLKKLYMNAPYTALARNSFSETSAMTIIVPMENFSVWKTLALTYYGFDPDSIVSLEFKRWVRTE